MKKITIAAGAVYLIALHVLVAIALFAPQLISDQRWRFGPAPAEPQSYKQTLQNYFLAQDREAVAGRLVLIGDSHFQRMDASGLLPPALNFGIGGDTVRNMAARASAYQSLSHSRAIVLWGGVNDLTLRPPAEVASDMQRLITLTESRAPVIILTIPPVALEGFAGLNEKISETNSLYKDLCARNCTYVDIHSLLAAGHGSLAPQFNSGDGIHLNAQGYGVVSAALTRALSDNTK